MESHYDVLGVHAGADQATIRRAFVEAARLHHPDRHVDAGPAAVAAAEDRMRRLNEAWSVLGDPASRAAYDRKLGGAVPAVVRRPTASNGRGHVAPEPSSGATAPRWLAILPPGLLAVAALCLAVGMVVNLTALLAAGLAAALLGGVAFVLVPVVMMQRSRADGTRRPDRR